jgi:hypothetical protein
MRNIRSLLMTGAAVAAAAVGGAAIANAATSSSSTTSAPSAGAVTTDYTGRGYEVDVTKNGTTTEVHLDTSFNVQSSPNGMHGGPGGPASSDTSPPYGPQVAG